MTDKPFNAARELREFRERHPTMSELSDWMREPDYVENASLEWAADWINRRPLAALAAAEQVSGLDAVKDMATWPEEIRAEHGLAPLKHDYISTACFHALHERCRKTCKFCSTDCRCTCHATNSTPDEAEG